MTDRGLHDYKQGERIAVKGDEYEIVGVDPTEDGVRAYHLDAEEMTARLDVNEQLGCFYLVLAGRVDPDEVSVVGDR